MQMFFYFEVGDRAIYDFLEKITSLLGEKYRWTSAILDSLGAGGAGDAG